MKEDSYGLWDVSGRESARGESNMNAAFPLNVQKIWLCDELSGL